MRFFLFHLLLLTSLQVFARSEKTVLVSVGDLTTQDGRYWAKQVCESLHETMNSVKSMNTQCLYTHSGSMIDERVRYARSKAQFHYHIQIYKMKNDHISAQITNWAQEDDTDFSTSPITFSDLKLEENQASLHKFVRNFVTYDKNKYLYKTQLLIAGLGESKQIQVNKDGVVVDSITHEPLTPKKAYAIYSEESPRQKHYLRAAIELSATLGFGLYKYYDNIASNKLDHDYQGFWNALKLKIKGDAAMTDDNSTAANVGHVLAGVTYYSILRSNGFSQLESTLWTIGSSAVWEYLMEYKEIMSVNDMIFTGWSGAVVGEVFYQMARAIRNKSNSLWAKTFAGILDPASALNGSLDNWMKNKASLVQKGDLDASQWSRMELSLGFTNAKFQDGKESASSTRLGFNGKVVNIPLYNEEGKAKGLVLNSPAVDMEMEIANGKFGISDWHFLGKTVLAAYYDKNLRKNDRDELSGYEYFIGISSAFEWDQKNSNPGAYESSTRENRDFIANAHVIGSTIQVNGFYRGLKVSFTMDIFADYAMVSSYALEEYENAGNSRDGLLSVLRKRGYYYGSGWTTALQLKAQYKRTEVGTSYQNTALEKSDLVKHRFQDQVTNDADYRDDRSIAKIWISYALTKSTQVKLAYEVIKRSGEMSGGFARLTTEKKVMGYLLYLF
ncbi:MAG: hypothetical protein BroJett040_05830 [Oligoflexia bacterium]|nr:MAG: hypothetical protein BroJett040_05830 [Oligoflexia bacterium]